MRSSIDRFQLNLNIRYSPRLELLYLSNAKAACTTIISSLWKRVDVLEGTSTFRGNTHSRNDAPFVKNIFAPEQRGEDFGRATVFSVVRNPFSRILSAYLDKVGRDMGVWDVFVRRFGLKETVGRDELSFVDFLLLIDTEVDELLDIHFRPQYLNIFWPICSPTFIGRLERFGEVEDFLQERGVSVERLATHSTGSADLLEEYYTPRAIELVRKKFSPDFDLFGYSRDPFCKGVPGPVPGDGGKAALLTDWVEQEIFPAQHLDDLSHQYDMIIFGKRIPTPEGLEELVSRDDNWGRLKDYFSLAQSISETSLAEKIAMRIRALTAMHYDRVENFAIFKNRIS